MPSKKTPAVLAPVEDPTLPVVPLTIEGVEYKLCFDYNALGVADKVLKQQKADFNIFTVLSLRLITPELLPFYFFAALVRFQPELTLQQAIALVTFKTASDVLGGVVDAYEKAMGSAEKADDPTPEPAAAP